MDGGRDRRLAPGRAGRTTRRLAAVLIGVGVGLTLTPAAAADPAPGPVRPAGGAGSLSELRDAAAEQSQAVESARAELAALATQAAAALEAYSVAEQTYQVARDDQLRAERALVGAEAELTRSRAELGRWARQAYYAGTGLATSPSLVTLLGGTSDDVGYSQQLLANVGNRRHRVVEATTSALTARQTAADTAQRAADTADAALQRAGQLRAARDEAVTAQRAALAQLESQLRGTQAATAQAEARALRLAQARRPGGGADGNAVTGPVGSCTGGQMNLYPNGEIPIEALCPLWAAPGEHLRADAAYAFDQMSAAYARRFGRAICVTDSYRSYAEQVAVKAAKPGLAATPGTSNHGWGTAVDLCGGVQSFDSEEHQWLVVNAPGFGWFHPSWAHRDGSRPEPWHWEFGG